MIKTVIAILIVTLLAGGSQAFSENADKVLFIKSEILFDSDGDGVKSDLAVLSALGGSGGYGQHLLEVYADGRQKIFDSSENAVDTVIAELPADAETDSIYSVEAEDIDGDGRDELVCRQYVWQECHSNHIGDAISVLKKNGNSFEIAVARFEAVS